MRFVAPDRFAELKATGKLPSPKGVALSIIRLLQREDYRVPDLVQLVQSDPAIAGRILYFANAAAFGRSRPIISLQRAIVALGSFRVRDLVIGLSVMHNHRSGQCLEFDYEKFWGHSLATGIACQELARFAQIASEEIFTIGLLSRIGELALFPAQRRITWSGKDVALTNAEFNLLEVLIQKAGQVVSKNLLSEQGLGRDFQRYDRSIDVHLSSIRRKLPPLPDGRPRIQAVLRKGYQLLTE